MTIDEIASFCEYKDCQVQAGHSDTGFIQINGRGLDRDLYTWGRFNMLGEVKNPPSPQKILGQADRFRILRGSDMSDHSREDFEKQLKHFQQLIS